MTHIGDRLTKALADEYRIERVLGTGGMATVYLATDLKHQRSVAVKVLRSDVSDTIGAERFLREIRIAAGLTHPNILPLHDSGRVDGLLYYVMPYVEGRSLRDILNAEKQLPVEDALQIAREVADALAHAHEKGIVHRDIKPANVLVESGHAVVCDFGVAKAIAAATEDDQISKQGVAIGTPAYMSPEQATGEQKIDGRSDIYALGCVLYEMLIGEAPFTGPTPMAILARHAMTPPPSLRTVRDSVPPWLERTIHRALSKSPVDRFATALDFRRALQGPRLSAPRVRWAVVAGGGALVAAIALTVVLSRRTEADTLVPKRVVVAPFANRTGSPELDHLGVMAADWITQGLQVTGMVDVIPTPTALQSARYVETFASQTRVSNRRGSGDPIRLLAAETLAGTVISGAYYREGETLQFQVQITDVAAGKLLGAPEPVTASIDAPSAAIAELRTRLMGSLATSFDERLKGFSGEAIQPPKYEAYREYALGIESYVGGRYAQALPHFYEASRLDSTFINAMFFASLNHFNLGEYTKADSLLRKVEPYRNRLSGYDRHWLDYREALMRGDRPRALRAIRLAASSAPGSKAVYNLAIEALENGYVDEALHALQRLTPERGAMRGWMPYWDALASVHHMRGDHRRELSVARRFRDIYPGRQLPIGAEVRAMAALGDSREIKSRIQQSLRLAQDASGGSHTAVMREAAEELRAHGHSDDAREVYMELLRWYESRPLREASRAENRWGRAEALYALGEYSQAVTVADSLSSEHPDSLTYLGLVGRANARLGNRDKAARVSERLRLTRRPYLYGLHTQNRAFIASVRGERERAVALLRQALAEGRPYDLWLHRNSDLEPLKDFPPFGRVRQAR